MSAQRNKRQIENTASKQAWFLQRTSEKRNAVQLYRNKKRQNLEKENVTFWKKK